MTRIAFRSCTLAVLSQVVLASLWQPAPAQAQSGGGGGSFDSSGRYVLSEGERKLDCRKINGRILVRVMQLRAELSDANRPSSASQALQQATSPALKLMYGGGSNYGTDRTSQLRRDRAMLEAYNIQLAAKNCPTYDLDAELKKGPSDPAPSPVRPSVKK